MKLKYVEIEEYDTCVIATYTSGKYNQVGGSGSTCIEALEELFKNLKEAKADMESNDETV